MIKRNSAERITIYLNTKEEWRFWLENNHHITQSIWVICNTKKSNLPTGQNLWMKLCVLAGLIARGGRLIPIHLCSYLVEESQIVHGLKSIKKKLKN